MAERDRFELDLRAALRGYAEGAPMDVRPTAIAHQFAVAHPHRRGLVGRWGFGPTPAKAWLLLAAGLLLAVVLGGLVAGALRQDRAVEPGIEVLPPGPATYTRIVAIARDELWAVDGMNVWHFHDGAWASEVVDPGRWDDLTLAPDGTLWAVGAEGTAFRRDGRWVVVDAHAVSTVANGPWSAIAVDRDGTVWVAGMERGCTVWRLRSNGDSWTRTPVAGCPTHFASGGAVTSVAVDGQGAVWVGAHGFVVDALARYADGRWETTEVRAGLPKVLAVEILGVSATGDVWIRFQTSDGLAKRYARFDGTAWTVIPWSDVPERWVAVTPVAVAPDGAQWTSALAPYDERGWAYPYPNVTPPLTPLTVAPDGTVFAADAEGSLVRLVASSP